MPLSSLVEFVGIRIQRRLWALLTAKCRVDVTPRRTQPLDRPGPAPVHAPHLGASLPRSAPPERLPVILPVVLLQSGSANRRMPAQFAQLLEIPPDLPAEARAALLRFVPDFTFRLIELAAMPFDAIAATPFQPRTWTPSPTRSDAHPARIHRPGAKSHAPLRRPRGCGPSPRPPQPGHHPLAAQNLEHVV